MAASALQVPLAPRVADAEARTRVMRSGPEVELPWEMWERTPPPHLAGRVARLWAGVSPAAADFHRTLPNGELTLMVHLGPSQRLTERDGAPSCEVLADAFLAGLQERPHTYVCMEAQTAVAAVQLRPLGGFALFGGHPQGELSRQVLELEAVLGGRADVRALRQRMGEAPDLGVALDWLEDWVTARLEAAHEPHAATREACALLEASGGSLRVEELARRTGASSRRLHELFRREVGVPAKRLARILRFRRTLERLAAAPAVDLALLAQECGYYDQAHLYRDFRALATLTPRQYLAAQADGFLDGPDVIGG